MRAVHLMSSLCLLAWGCGSCAEKATSAAVEAATGVKVDGDQGKVTFKGAQGTVEVTGGEGQKAPDDLPVPAPADAKVVMVTRSPQGTQTVLQTATAPDRLATDWEAALKGKGYTVEKMEQSAATVQTVMLTFKGEAFEGSAQAIRDSSSEDGTMATITWQKRPAEH